VRPTVRAWDKVHPACAQPQRQEPRRQALPAMAAAAPSAGWLSPRGLEATVPALSYFPAFVAAAADPWRPEAPERGVINLCVAEDKLSADLAAQQLAAQAASAAVPPQELGYTDMRGTAQLKAAFARFVTRTLAPGVPCEPQQLCISAGCGAIFELLGFTLASAGDAFLVPAPLYAAFRNDLRVRAGVHVVAVAEPDGALVPSIAALEAARLAAAAAGTPPRALLMCNPGNPTGQVLPPDRVREMIAWALAAGLHVISDEVYSGSVFAPAAGPPFVSAAAHARDGIPGVAAEALRDRLHLVFGFSKDFAMSGMRAGVLWSANDTLHKALMNLGYFCGVSVQTQLSLAALLDDAAWMDGFLAERHRRLRAAHDAVASALDAAGVPHAAAGAGMFVWLDLRQAMPAEATAADERAAWSELFEGDARLLLTPGLDCAAPAPGFFRACYAAVDPAALPHVATRLKRFLEARRARGACAAA
jgi:1-aminocyclopropane-1-carboxylate synthase